MCDTYHICNFLSYVFIKIRNVVGFILLQAVYSSLFETKFSPFKATFLLKYCHRELVICLVGEKLWLNTKHRSYVVRQKGRRFLVRNGLPWGDVPVLLFSHIRFNVVIINNQVSLSIHQNEGILCISSAEKVISELLHRTIRMQIPCIRMHM